ATPAEGRAARGRAGTVGVDEVETGGEVEERLDALRGAVHLVVAVGVVVPDLERLAEVGEGVEAVCGVGGAEPVDGVEHLAPGGEGALDHEVRLDTLQALADMHAVEYLEGECELGGPPAARGQHAQAAGGLKEAERGEARAIGVHLALQP